MTLNPNEFFDISPLVHAETPVFPGDTPFQQKVLMDFKRGDPFFLSTITSTVHVGAHADGPFHFHPEGECMHEVDLGVYMGPAQVVDLKLSKGERVFPRHLDGIEVRQPRLLFKTDSFSHQLPWQGDFNSLSAELIEYLAEKKVVLVGIDTPSVDPADEKILTCHHKLFEKKIANLEGLLLKNVPEGDYELIALPLKLKGVEGSPVRAVLRSLQKGQDCERPFWSQRSLG